MGYVFGTICPYISLRLCIANNLLFNILTPFPASCCVYSLPLMSIVLETDRQDNVTRWTWQIRNLVGLE